MIRWLNMYEYRIYIQKREVRNFYQVVHCKLYLVDIFSSDKMYQKNPISRKMKESKFWDMILTHIEWKTFLFSPIHHHVHWKLLDTENILCWNFHMELSGTSKALDFYWTEISWQRLLHHHRHILVNFFYENRKQIQTLKNKNITILTLTHYLSYQIDPIYLIDD